MSMQKHARAFALCHNVSYASATSAGTFVKFCRLCTVKFAHPRVQYINDLFQIRRGGGGDGALKGIQFSRSHGTVHTAGCAYIGTNNSFNFGGEM